MLIKCTQNIQFFKDFKENYGEESINKFYRFISHKYYNQGDVIFEEGNT